MTAQLIARRFAACALIPILAGIAGAQAITPPNIKGPINAAKAAAEKTNEQTRTAEKVVADPAQQKAAPQKAAAKAGTKAPAKADTGSGAVSQVGRQRGAVTLYREAFTYTDNGKRDPFISLMASGELRPIFSDLTLTGVIFGQAGRGSIAMLVDGSTGEAYGARVGDALGRMKVTRIGLQDITFTIDEFGLSRSETLIIDKTKKAGPPAARRP